MQATGKCPQCGADLEAGAAICKACGHQLTDAEQTTPAPEPAPPPRPEYIPPAQAQPAMHSSVAKEQKGSSFDVQAMLAETRERWGVADSSVFLAALALIGGALVIGTIGVIMWLIAGEDDGSQREDGFLMLAVAITSAVGAAGLLTYLRLEIGPLSGDAHPHDRMLAFVVGGFSVLFLLLSIFKGLGEGLSAESAYYYYALLFAFFLLCISVIARPLPSSVAGVSISTVGFAAIGVAVILSIFGAIQYRSDSFSTYATGATLLDASLILGVLTLAWFLGMRKAA